MNDRNKIIKDLIKKYTEIHSASPDAARKALINEGIYNSDGTLKLEFGGEK